MISNLYFTVLATFTVAKIFSQDGHSISEEKEVSSFNQKKKEDKRMNKYVYVGDKETMEAYIVEQMISENPEEEEFILKMWEAGWLFI